MPVPPPRRARSRARVVLVVTLALAALLSSVPGASADVASDSHHLEATGPAADVVRLDVSNIHTLPPGSPRLANVTVTFCAGSSAVNAAPTQLRVVAPDAPEWLTLDVEPETFTFALVIPGECDTARGVARFNATPDAPAFEIVRVVIQAVDARDGSARAETDYFLRVGYHGDLVVTPAHGRVSAPKDAFVPHEMHVKNLGNADTTFRLHVAGSREDVQVAIPAPLVLAPGESGTWDITVLVPAGTGSGPRHLELLVTSHARMDHEALGGSAVVRLTVEPTAAVASGGFTVPGLAPFAAAGALVLVAVVAVWRRRRGS